MINSIGVYQILRLFLLLSLIVIHKAALAATFSAYQLNPDSEPENLGIYTHYIEDKEGTLFLEDVIKLGDSSSTPTEEPQWSPASANGLAEGFTDSVYWLRFSIANTSDKSMRWNLEFRYPILDSIEYFSPNGQGEYTKQVAGDAYPFAQRQIDYRNVVFSQHTPANKTQTYYIRVDTSSSMFVPLHIWPQDSFFHEIDKVKLLLGILYGIVILALFISAVNAIFLKDMMYIWLSGIFICFFLYLGGIKGVAFQSLWPNSLYWQGVCIPFFMNMSIAFGFLYCRAYINLKELSPKLDTVFSFFTILGVVLALLSFVVEYRYIISISTVITVMSQVTCLVVGIYSWSKGNTAARLFVLSWTSLFFGAVSFTLVALGIIPKTFITEWMQELGFGAMVTLMIIAQFDRFLQLQKSHEKNQIASLEAVQNAEKKYRSLFENAIEGIFQMNAKGVLTNVNNAYANILGLEDPELLVETRDTPFSLGFMSESEGSKLEAMLSSKGSLSDYSISFASPTGEIRWASIAMQKVQGMNINDYHYEGSLTDITETKKREQAEKHQRMAEASTEAKSMFLANMSHEIRTPMNAIIGFTDLAVSANQDKNLSEFLRKIKTASSNLLGIINDILDFSKIEAGKLKIEAIPFNIRELMDNIREIVEGNIESKGLAFSIDIDEDIPDVLIGDSLRLHQILLNLTNNAVKFTPEGSVKVEIDLLAMNKKKGTIKLEGRVIDTGIGISQEKQSKLFTSFSQADENTTRTFGGTGLGLSISKQLITLMGGDISVRSIEDQGSVFEFNFQCRLESRKQRLSAHDSKLNVLIVDDNNDSRTLIENVIKELKHSYTCAASAQEALKMLKASQNDSLSYDLVLIDWLMPESDGFDCLKQIQALADVETPKTVLITSYGEEGLEERSIEAGFDAYVEKPLKKPHMHQIVTRFFGSTSNTPKVESGPNKSLSVPTETQLDTVVDPSSSLAGLRVLLVEDVAMNQELAKEILKKQGMSTFVANDGEQGVQAAESETFDVILMDMQMPIMDGCEATMAIREFDCDIPIIAMTANAMSEDKKRCLAAGMNDFVTKPINDKALFATIEKYISQGKVNKHKDETNHSSSEKVTVVEDIAVEDIESKLQPKEDIDENIVEALADTLDHNDNIEHTHDQLVPDNDDQEIQSSPSSSLPDSLPSIDLRDGLERCQGNQKLYIKLLGDFIRNYGDGADEMRQMLEDKDLIAVAKLAHTFKGLAANLGAKDLSDCAMKLEHIKDMEDQEQGRSIEAFKKQLATLIEELEPMLKEMNAQDSSEGSSEEPFTQQERLDFVSSLTEMIKEQKLDAYDQAVEAAEKWPDTSAKAELETLIEQLDLFEFEQAKSTIEAIRGILQ